MRAGAIVGNLGLPHDVEISAFALSGRNIGVHGNPTPVCAYLPKLLGTGPTHPCRHCFCQLSRSALSIRSEFGCDGTCGG